MIASDTSANDKQGILSRYSLLFFRGYQEYGPQYQHPCVVPVNHKFNLDGNVGLKLPAVKYII